MTDRWRSKHLFCFISLKLYENMIRQTGRQRNKQAVTGAVRQAVSPGILQQISKLSEDGDK